MNICHHHGIHVLLYVYCMMLSGVLDTLGGGVNTDSLELIGIKLKPKNNMSDFVMSEEAPGHTER